MGRSDQSPADRRRSRRMRLRDRRKGSGCCRLLCVVPAHHAILRETQCAAGEASVGGRRLPRLDCHLLSGTAPFAAARRGDRTKRLKTKLRLISARNQHVAAWRSTVRAAFKRGDSHDEHVRHHDHRA
jgi:hypothetical protein